MLTLVLSQRKATPSRREPTIDRAWCGAGTSAERADASVLRWVHAA